MSLPPGSPYASGPATIASSPAPSLADWGSYTSWLNAIINPARVSLYNSATLSPANVTWTLHTWDSELYKSDAAMHSTGSNTSRLVAPCTGLFDVKVQISFASNATGTRAIQIRKNSGGSVVGGSFVAEALASATPGSTATSVEIDKDVQLSSGDYLEVFIYQSSTVTISTIAGDGWSFASMRFVALS